MPESLTASCSRPGSLLALVKRIVPYSGRKLDSVVQQVPEHLLHASGVDVQGRLRRLRDNLKVDLLSIAVGLDDLHDVANQIMGHRPFQTSIPACHERCD